MSQEEADVREMARQRLDRAVRESGVKRPEDRPDLVQAFSRLPDSLSEIEDIIHELQAQAEACVGTDQSVSHRCGGCGL